MRIQTGGDKNALLVPQPAVIEVQSQYQVIVLTPDNKAMFRPVKMGERVGPNWIVTEGLKPGERVVVEGILKVQQFAAAAPELAKEGIPVVPKPYTPARAARAGATDHVEILYQSAHRRHRHRNSDGAGRRGRACSACRRQQFPNIADPMIQVKATYPGADAQTIAESVATPIEQQMSGVSGMNYMYSLSASSGGGMTLYVDFQLGTDINTDQILAQMRQRAGQLATAQPGDPAGSHRAAGHDGARSCCSTSILPTALTTTSSWPTTPPSICSTR